MAPAKLSPADKQALLERFRTTTAPVAALAEQFGVSVSTVSRILRSSFSPEEYEQLRDRRSRLTETADSVAVTPEVDSTPVVPKAADPSAIADPEPLPAEAIAPEPEPASGGRRRRRRSTAASTDSAEPATPELPNKPEAISISAPVSAPLAVEPPEPVTGEEAIAAPTPISEPKPAPERPRPIPKTAVTEAAIVSETEPEIEPEQSTAATQHISNTAIDLELTADDLRGGVAAIEDADEFGDDDSEDDELVFDEDDLAADGDSDRTEAAATLELLPLGIAPLPRTSYVVVDRTADLVTCSLTTLAELGTVEADHAEAQALPLFDNPRTAKRFCKRNQRVIKLPDSQILLKTTRWLQAKGIHCLLIDGQVYALDR